MSFRNGNPNLRRNSRRESPHCPGLRAELVALDVTSLPSNCSQSPPKHINRRPALPLTRVVSIYERSQSVADTLASPSSTFRKQSSFFLPLIPYNNHLKPRLMHSEILLLRYLPCSSILLKARMLRSVAVTRVPFLPLNTAKTLEKERLNRKEPGCVRVLLPRHPFDVRHSREPFLIFLAMLNFVHRYFGIFRSNLITIIIGRKCHNTLGYFSSSTFTPSNVHHLISAALLRLTTFACSVPHSCLIRRDRFLMLII